MKTIASKPYAETRFSPQQGSALVLSLLVLSLVASVVYYAQQNHWRYQRQNQILHGAERDLHYLYSAELMAAQLLQQDQRKNKTDHLNEPWARQQQNFPLDNGYLQLHLYDAQARFNINSLLQSANINSQHPLTRFSSQQKQFIRLLQCFEPIQVSQSQAIEITEAIIDWLDSDENPTGYGGFESLQYIDRSVEKPYQAANRLFSDASELRLIHNISTELFLALRPHVVALPEGVGLNINTASPVLLRSLNQDNNLSPLSYEQAQYLSEQRLQKPFLQVQDIQRVLSGVTISKQGLQVSSNYFFLHSRIQTNQKLSINQSLLSRNNQQLSLVKRLLNQNPIYE